MRASRIAVVLWLALIAVLLFVEILEITHVFTLPVQNALSDPVAFVSAIVFTTLVALVGAIFIGVWVSHRLLSPGGFTPFEEEMLQMRAEVREIRQELTRLSGKPHVDPPEVDPEPREGKEYP